MTVPVLLHGALAAHRRGRILREALSAEATTTLPASGAVIMSFADAFQGADEGEQARLVEWTRAAGHVLLLVPPFAAGACERPVAWRAERMEGGARGGEGLAKMLAGEVTHRLEGKLQTPPLPGATWSDLSVCVGTYRLHPAAGLFAVTCLPLWSLAVLDAPEETQRWLVSLIALAGEAKPVAAPAQTPLSPDHYGLLVFLLSRSFEDDEQAIAALRASSIFRIAPERARALLNELRARGLVMGAVPTTEATELVMQSPYAPYVSALREVTTP
ncbi:hypothetical protein F0U61_40810 [Archangium violaceum]|uniref:hypothetical protein n=1 Tax=Archangium violaceum TaxID=83451 RepID=UPI002B302F99|nr:hypothetical protein F0U61_40810 [Archangium violaceum]